LAELLPVGEVIDFLGLRSRLKRATFKPRSWTKARLIKPRTVCGCHWVTRAISAMEAPFERCSMRMTYAFLVHTRTV
jgi:hypothetical protein